MDAKTVVGTQDYQSKAKARLEELRYRLDVEAISQDELMELQELVKYIEPDDTQLMEAAGVPESLTGSLNSFPCIEGLHYWAVRYNATLWTFFAKAILDDYDKEIGEVAFGTNELNILAEALSEYTHADSLETCYAYVEWLDGRDC